MRNFASLLILFLMSSTIVAQDIIAPKEAVKMLNTKGVVIVDCNDVDDYAKVHVTNAINIWHEELYKKGTVDGMLKEPAELAKYFGGKGISHNSTILLYDAGHNKYCGRLYWVLNYLGAQNVKIISGGMGEWQKNRLPVTKAPGKLPTAQFQVSLNENINIGIQQVKKNLGNSKTIMVDVRDADEFKGKTGNNKRKGHIPGAINLEFRNVQNENGILKSKEVLQKLFNAAGITPDKEVIIYCTTSVRAGIVFFALKSVLGYPNVKVFDGAYNEWESDAANDVKQ